MKVSVIIPVKNGAATLARCLQSITSQSIAAEIEIIILDSMSTDESREIALQYGAIIIDIPGNSFNHGLTRNLGVKYATGDLIYLTVQDASIAEVEMLGKMATHFDDKEVMGVVGHQAVPHEKDKNPLLWFKRFSKPEITIRQVQNATEFEKLPVAAQQKLVAWDNVVAMYRKTALLQQPFVATEFAEDWIWSEQALRRGWKLIHDANIVAWHYHHRGFSYAFRVAYAMNYHFYQFLGYRPAVPAFLSPMLKATYHIFKNPVLGLKEKCYWAFHNYAGISGTFFSHINFLWRLQTGSVKSVEKGYKKYCKDIPQGKQKKY
ncbi:MAG: glycosyltransferase family 2 protein [Bacteroidota bacterium]|nr:glycosyltransferase family 2 protein [Bacteroidota bacterium]